MHAIDPENFKNFERRDKNKFSQDEYLGIQYMIYCISIRVYVTLYRQ